ncbi:MAG: type III pantothenate kinase [Eubacterium sp.]|nr:type III pantothenate kinase [Eubacterium sp.]
MILAIDVGNTNVVLGCIRAKKILFIERISTDRNKTAAEYAIMIKSILEIHQLDMGELEGGIISSVVPEITYELRRATRLLIGKDPIIVGPGIKTGLNILLDDPAQLGSDMLVTAVAAMSENKLPVIIVDLGTATTLSLINEKRQFMGGMIFPGIRTALNSLVSSTSLLQQISLNSPKKVIGTNTIDCMKSGIIYGNAAMIDGLVDRIEAEVGECTVVATGGLAKSISKHCRHKIILDNDLLLKGLRIIYEKNT